MEKTNTNTYTEKITLRLTQEDKEAYQIEADAKKVPLTTLLRNKISGIDLDDEVFQSQLIYYDRSEHNRKNYEANKHLRKFDNIKNIVSSYIDLPTTDEGWTGLMTNPQAFVKNQLDLKHRPQINLPISIEKILDLLGIDLSPIDREMDGYDNRFLTVVDGEVTIRDYRGEFEHYTTHNEENERLALSHTLIDSFNKIIEGSNVSRNQHALISATNNKLRYSSGLIPNVGYVKNSKYL